MKRTLLLFCLVLSSTLSGQPLNRPWLKAMENRMSVEEKEMLQSIYAPTVVATPLEDARRSVCILPDGEIRCYGSIERDKKNPKGKAAYLSSVDGGLTWKTRYSHGKMGACTYIPVKDIFVTSRADAEGTWFLISKIGPEDPEPEQVKISSYRFSDCFQPTKSDYSDRIFFTGQRRNERNESVPTFIYTDDYGKTFHLVELPHPPKPEIVFPHQGIRWSNDCGTEPMACEISLGKMMMLIRNATDAFYQSFSEDGGTTWSDPEPSVFQGCITTPFMLRLSDGRILNFWNNTRPLPELDHEKQMPPVAETVKDGTWEDVFTNRDVAHAAISSDKGENWTGVRELYLNGIRNNADFRYVGGVLYSLDKSVHQFQAFELPFNKILVSVGQNPVSRRMLIFDLDWLKETDRQEDFMDGLGGLSTFVYVKSISGSAEAYVGNGHCAWNRTNGALLVPDPEGGYSDVLQLSKYPDERLFNDLQGLTWNFPASHSGQVEIGFYLSEDVMRISLTDCWFNPCDPYVDLQAQFSVDLSSAQLPVKSWHTLKLDYDPEWVVVSCDGRQITRAHTKKDSPLGLSYLHMQCRSDAPTSKGFYIRSLQAKSR